MTQIFYVGQEIADMLADNIERHLDRYMSGDFLDMESQGGWKIPLTINADVDQLSLLDPTGTPEAEISNSLLVGRILSGLTPALARENRIWVRLSHIEALEYTRKRWLKNINDNEKISKKIRAHFFAQTLTKCRDDHSIGRLWWNYRIAAMLLPDDPAQALSIFLERADIRSNLIERSRAGGRIPLARAILAALIANPEVRKNENAFRTFMKAINLRAAGLMFELLDQRKLDTIIKSCIERAQNTLSGQN